LTSAPLPDPDISTPDDWYEHAQDHQHTIGAVSRELDEGQYGLPYLIHMQVNGLVADAAQTMAAIDDTYKHSNDPRIGELVRMLAVDMARIAAHVEHLTNEWVLESATYEWTLRIK
jgi:hypothetical protein